MVLYMNVDTPASGLEDSSRTTGEIIDLALKHDGTFFLPYVLNYGKSQLTRAYPVTSELLAAKRRYDPAGIFYNDFYARYSH